MVVIAHMPRILYAAGSILGSWPLAVAAQQVPVEPPQEQTTPGPRTAPKPGPQVVPSPPKPPAVTPSERPAAQSLMGLGVFSSDGTRVGEVRSVNTSPTGDVVAIHVRTGGFLGFGGRIVAIPGERFIRSGQSIRLDLDADEVNRLPEVKD